MSHVVRSIISISLSDYVVFLINLIEAGRLYATWRGCLAWHVSMHMGAGMPGMAWHGMYVVYQ